MSVVRAALIFLGAIATIAAWFTFYVYGWITDPELYTKAAESAKLYDAFETELVDRTVLQPTADIKTDRLQRKAVREEGISIVKEIFSREWQIESTRKVLEQTLRYLRDPEAHFSLELDLKDRADAAISVLVGRLPESLTFEYLYDGGTELFGKAFRSSHPKLPFGIKIGAQEARDLAREAIPREWIAEQAANTLDSMRLYAIGEEEHFQYLIPLNEREEAFVQIIETLIDRADAYDFLIEHAVTPAVQQNLDSIIQLPFGVKLTDAEVVNAFKQVITEDWVLARKTEILRQGADYLTGRSDGLAITVPLTDRKTSAMHQLTELVDQRLQQGIAEMPACSPVELLHSVGRPTEELTCRPPGSSFAASKRMLGFRVAEQVESKIGSLIPDKVTYTTANMREHIGQKTWEAIQVTRVWLRKGIPLNDRNLHSFLGPGRGKTLDDALKIAQTGVDLDDAWLQTTLPNAKQRKRIHDVRKGLSYLSTARWLSLLLALILLGSWLALLRGRTAVERLRAASLFLTVISGVLLVVGIAARSSLLALIPDKIVLGGPLEPIQAQVPAALNHLARSGINGWLGACSVFLIIGLLSVLGAHQSIKSAHHEQTPEDDSPR